MRPRMLWRWKGVVDRLLVAALGLTLAWLSLGGYFYLGLCASECLTWVSKASRVLGIATLHIGGAVSLALTTWSVVGRIPYRFHAIGWGVASLLYLVITMVVLGGYT